MRKHFLSTIILTAISTMPIMANAQQDKTNDAIEIENPNFFPKFNCSSDLKLKEIKNFFPPVGGSQANANQAGILSDDFLPIAQNGSIWINKERELAAQIQLQNKGPNFSGEYNIVIKNYCKPKEKSAKNSHFLAQLNGLNTALLNKNEDEGKNTNVLLFKIEGTLIPADAPTYLQLSFAPATKPSGLKKKLVASILQKDSPEAESKLVDRFYLENLKELEK